MARRSAENQLKITSLIKRIRKHQRAMTNNEPKLYGPAEKKADKVCGHGPPRMMQKKNTAGGDSDDETLISNIGAWVKEEQTHIQSKNQLYARTGVSEGLNYLELLV